MIVLIYNDKRFAGNHKLEEKNLETFFLTVSCWQGTPLLLWIFGMILVGSAVLMHISPHLTGAAYTDLFMSLLIYT